MENRNFFKPITIEDIFIVFINLETVWQQNQLYILAGCAGEYGPLN